MVLLTADSLPQLGGITNYLAGLIKSTADSLSWYVYSATPKAIAGDWPVQMHQVDLARNLGQRAGDSFSLSRKFNSIKWRYDKRPNALALLSDIHAKHNPEYIVIHRWCDESHHWCHASQKLGLKYILIAHGMEFFETFSSFPINIPGSIQKDFSEAAFVIANSSATLKLALNAGANKAKSHIINPGIWEADLIRPGESQLNGRLTQLQSKRFIFTLGRMVHRKGFDLTIHAFETLAAESPEIVLVIAGCGPLENAIKQQVQKSAHSQRIFFLGEISDTEKDSLFKECEFYMMPNRPLDNDMEGFGIVFIEANIYKKACIGGNNGGVPDAVEHAFSGLCVDSPDLDSITAGMKQLIDDKEFCRQLGQQGSERVSKKFLWNDLGAKFIEIIKTDD